MFFIDPDGMMHQQGEIAQAGYINDDEVDEEDMKDVDTRSEEFLHGVTYGEGASFSIDEGGVIASGNKKGEGGKGKNKPKHEQPTNIPPPKDLPGFPGSTRLPHQDGKRPAWRLPNGGVGEWDRQHGEVEVYDKTGKDHKGGHNPDTGELQRDPDGRTATRSKYQLEPIEYSTMPIQTIVIKPLTPTQTYTTVGIIIVIGAILLSPVGL